MNGQEEAFRAIRERLQQMEPWIRSALRYSAQLPGEEGAAVVGALEELSRTVATARKVGRLQHQRFRARLAAAAETIPPEDRG